MSLINDALKRARHQVLRQEAESDRNIYRAVPVHSRGPARPWLPYIVGSVLTATVLLAWMALRNGDAVTSEPIGAGSAGAVERPTAGREEPTSPVAAPLETESSSTRDRRSNEPEDPGDGGPADEVVTLPVTPLAPEAGAGRQGLEGARDALAPETQAASPRPVSEASDGEQLQDGRRYLRSVTAADGSTVELGGIAYSEARPIAVINGSVITPGDMIAGFTVIAIEPEHVELETGGVRILLVLH